MNFECRREVKFFKIYIIRMTVLSFYWLDSVNDKLSRKYFFLNAMIHVIDYIN